VGNRSF